LLSDHLHLHRACKQLLASCAQSSSVSWECILVTIISCM
jgi:hypothetical protein